MRIHRRCRQTEKNLPSGIYDSSEEEEELSAIFSSSKLALLLSLLYILMKLLAYSIIRFLSVSKIARTLDAGKRCVGVYTLSAPLRV